jgi:hypothetical protein
MKTKFITANITALVIACSCLINVASASLITIDFESFPTETFTQGVENGVNISAKGPDTKIINPGFNTGNTAFSDGGSFLIPSEWTFAFDNGLFTFEKFDIGSFYNPGDRLTVVGWLEGLIVGEDNYQTTTTKWNGQLSTEIATNLENVMVDKIQILMFSTHQHYGVVDNVVMNKMPSVVPEPSTLAIFALGLMGLAARRFKNMV